MFAVNFFGKYGVGTVQSNNKGEKKVKREKWRENDLQLLYECVCVKVGHSHFALWAHGNGAFLLFYFILFSIIPLDYIEKKG